MHMHIVLLLHATTPLILYCRFDQQSKYNVETCSAILTILGHWSFRHYGCIARPKTFTFGGVEPSLVELRKNLIAQKSPSIEYFPV